MNNEKRLFLAFVLSFIVLLSYQKFAPKPQIASESIKSEQKLIPESANIPLEANKIPLNKDLETANTIFKTFETELYSIQYSEIGGYLKNITIKEFDDVLQLNNLFLIPDYQDKKFEVIQQSNSLIFSYSSQDVEIYKEIEFKKDYVLNFKFKSSKPLSYIYMSQTKDSNMANARYQELVYDNDKVIHLSFKKIKDMSRISFNRFAGVRSRYYISSILDTSNLLIRKQDSNIILIKENDKESINTFYIGPQSDDYLKKHNIEDIVSYGFFNSIAVILLKVISFYYKIFNNWGISVIFLALSVYFICFPLTSKSTRSMKKMQEIQPEMEKLKEKYKDNPQRFQQETMELYKKYKVNPMSGCFPLLLQMPIFISLYQILYRLVDLKGAKFLWINDLSKPDYLIHFSTKLPLIGDGFHLLPLIMGLLTFLQQKMTGKPNQMTEQQQTMLFMMPIILLFIFYRFPSGLVLYWMTNSFLTFSYQLYLAKKK